jgi:hypothetical protein
MIRGVWPGRRIRRRSRNRQAGVDDLDARELAARSGPTRRQRGILINPRFTMFAVLIALGIS